jgi:ABC-type transport system involved in multi-copper enzyme maturation permease subunit
MKISRLKLGLPLLTKELIEQAARRRTYVVRVVYACLLFCAAYLMFYQILSTRGYNLFQVIGRGREMFNSLVGLQFVGIYLFMPAITCSALTNEKERNTLSLLFLTKLGPWTILSEKLLSRVIPMFSFLLLSLPLLAFTYSLGGVETVYLWSGVWMLGLSVLQMGTLALCCSAYFRTTVGSFIGSYLFGLALFFLLPICFGFIWEQPRNFPRLEILTSLGLFSEPENIPFMFFGPYVFYERSGTSFPLLASVPILFSCVWFFVWARIFIVRRAFVQPRYLILKMFRWLDGFFLRLNDRYTRGILLTRESTTLPGEAPVAWRETTKKSLGTTRYLFRVFLALEIPVVCVCILIAQSHHSDGLRGAMLMIFFLWLISVLVVSVKAAGLIAGERSHQTLDVLLATPMSGREIMRQKFRGIWRLIAVLSVPFLTVFLMVGWWKTEFSSLAYSYNRGGREFSATLYLTCSLLSLFIYLPLVAWLSFAIGLWVRTLARAIISSLTVLVVWCLGPFVLLAPFASVYRWSVRSPLNFSLLSSPASIIGFNEVGELSNFGNLPWAAVIVNFLVYGFILAVIRWGCLLHADRLLGRNEDGQGAGITTVETNPKSQ